MRKLRLFVVATASAAAAGTALAQNYISVSYEGRINAQYSYNSNVNKETVAQTANLQQRIMISKRWQVGANGAYQVDWSNVHSTMNGGGSEQYTAGTQVCTASWNYDYSVAPYPGISAMLVFRVRSGTASFSFAGVGLLPTDTSGPTDRGYHAQGSRTCTIGSSTSTEKLSITDPPTYNAIGKVVDEILAAGKDPQLGAFSMLSFAPLQNGALKTSKHYSISSGNRSKGGATWQETWLVTIDMDYTLSYQSDHK